MTTENKNYSRIELPFELNVDCWGELNEAIEACPGVYHVCTSPRGEEDFVRKLYVVTRAAVPSVISPEVIAHGIAVGDVWVFEYTTTDSIYNLVKFELMQYRVRNKLPIDRTEGSFYGTAVYCAEYFPWYFGGTIPPRNTPLGLTIRVKKAGEGLFFLETDRCQWVLAVSFPIWDLELSEYTKSLGMICNDGLSARAEESRYLFFAEEVCVPAIYELLLNPDHNGLRAFIESKEKLTAYLQEHFPEYTMDA